MSFLSRLFGAFRNGTSLGPADARAWLEEHPDAVIMDVRSRGEVASGTLKGAVNVPLGLVPQRAARLDPNQAYLLVCLSGARSGRAAAILRKQGFTDVRNLRGGVTAWRAAGFPLTRK